MFGCHGLVVTSVCMSVHTPGTYTLLQTHSHCSGQLCCKAMMTSSAVNGWDRAVLTVLSVCSLRSLCCLLELLQIQTRRCVTGHLQGFSKQIGKTRADNSYGRQETVVSVKQYLVTKKADVQQTKYLKPVNQETKQRPVLYK